jgi:hypothetical protein
MTTEIVAAASSGNSNLRNITNYQDFLNNRK